MKLKYTWTELKQIMLNKKLFIQHKIDGLEYIIWTEEGTIVYYCKIDIDSIRNTEQIDFEDNYKTDSNMSLQPRNNSGKLNVVMSSRPLKTTTSFTMRGDSATDIGDGNIINWDFNNSNNEVTASTGFKTKQVDLTFIDQIWIKEGAFYHYNAIKGSYIDVDIVCPAGQYYKDNNNNIQLAATDISIFKYVNHHLFYGDTTIGDQLNTEESQEDGLPPGYIIRFTITVPDTDVTSFGWVQVELFRKRTIIL